MLDQLKRLEMLQPRRPGPIKVQQCLVRSTCCITHQTDHILGTLGTPFSDLQPSRCKISPLSDISSPENGAWCWASIVKSWHQHCKSAHCSLRSVTSPWKHLYSIRIHAITTNVYIYLFFSQPLSTPLESQSAVAR